MNNKSKRLLVVGGSGFIGSHIVSRGLELGWNASILSLHGNKAENLSGVQRISADIADRNALSIADVLRAVRFAVWMPRARA